MSARAVTETRTLSFPALRVEQPWEQPITGRPVENSYVAHAAETLEAGRIEYRLGYLRESAARAQDLTVRIRHRLAQVDRVEGDARPLARIAARAATLVGRTRRILRDDSRARKAFDEAVSLFERSGADSLTADELTDYGIALSAVGRESDAVIQLETAIQQGGESSDALRYLGQSLHQRGDIARAEHVLRRAVETAPREPTPRRMLGNVLEASNAPAEAAEHLRLAAFAFIAHQRLREALETFDDAIRLGDDDPSMHAARGELLRRLERPAEALQSVDRALALDPELAWAWACRAATLYGLAEFDAALESVKSALIRSPDYALAHELHGRLLRIHGDEPAAIDALRTAIRLEPTLLGAYVELGVALFAACRPDQATEVLRKGLAQAPDVPWFMAAIGEAFRAGGYLDDAVELLREAVRRAPQLGAAEVALADALVDRDEPGAALEAVDRAAVAGMRTPAALRRMSRVYSDLGRLREAEALLRRALELKPDSRSSSLQLAAVLVRLRRSGEAIDVLDQALSAYPEDAPLLSDKGKVLRAQGRLREAVQPLRRAIESAPSAIDAQLDLVRCLWRLGRDDEAQTVVADVLARRPENPSALALRAAINVTLGHAHEAMADLDLACADAPEDGFAAAMRARVRLEARDGDAANELQRAVDLEPSDVEALGELGDVLRRFGRAEDALAHLERARERAPDSPWIIGTIGQVQAQQGRLDEAVETLRRAVDCEPSIAWIRAALGETLRARGDARAALEELSAALKLRPGYAWVLASMGAAYRDLECLADSIDALEQAVSLAPEDWFSLTVLGCSLVEAGEYADAVVHLEAATDLIDGHPWPWAMKGWALQLLGPGRARDALAAYERSLEVGADDFWCRRGLADVWMMLGETEDSRREYQTVVDAAGNGATLNAYELASVGWCWYALGRSETAMSYYSEALYRDPGMVPAEFDFALALAGSGRCHHWRRQFDRACEHTELLDPLRRRGILEVVVLDMRNAQEYGLVSDDCVPLFASALPDLERDLAQAREDAARKLREIRAGDAAPGSPVRRESSDSGVPVTAAFHAEGQRSASTPDDSE